MSAICDRPTTTLCITSVPPKPEESLQEGTRKRKHRISVSENISTNVARCFFCRLNACMSELPILQFAARRGEDARIVRAALDNQRSGIKRRKLLSITDRMLSQFSGSIATMRQSRESTRNDSGAPDTVPDSHQFLSNKKEY